VKDTVQVLIPQLELKDDSSFLDQQLEFYQEVKKNLLSYVKETGKPNEIHQ
jgi:pyruvate dehydrogenase (quinone)